MEDENIVLDGVEYAVAELTDKAKHILDHLKDLNIKTKKASMELEQLKLCTEAMTAILSEEVTTPTQEEFVAS
jgi:hypothetical protein